MTTYTFTKVLVWDNLGGTARVARNVQRIIVTDTLTGQPAPDLKQDGQPVPWLKSDASGHVSWTSSAPVVRLTTPTGFWVDVISPDYIAEGIAASQLAADAAASAAASAQASRDAANLVGAPAKAAMDAAMGGDVAGLVPTVAAKAERAQLTVNVDNFGAKGDGATDDTAAFQAAIDSLPPLSGGRVTGTPGKAYRLANRVDLRSNLTVDLTGVRIIKTKANSASSVCFMARSKGATGYGSSVRNVKIKGGTYIGDFAGGWGLGLAALHHAQDVTIDGCYIEQACTYNHVLDIGGCDGVTVKNCTFAGANPGAGYEYIEAIQVGYSAAKDIYVDNDAPSSYDGLATRNVTVENNRFIPLTIGSTTYHAPRAFGQHSFVEGRPIQDVTFEKNLIRDARRTDDMSSGFVSIVKGWVHFVGAYDVKILNNRFECSDNRSASIITSYGTAVGMALADVANPDAPSQTLTALSARDWLIDGNTFVGVKGTATSESLISIAGTSSVYAEGITVTNNKFRDCYPTPGTDSGTGHHGIYMQYARDVTVDNNTSRECRTLFLGENVDRVTCTRNKAVGYWYTVRTNNSNRVTVADNDIRTNGTACVLLFGNVAGVDTANIHDNQLVRDGSAGNIIRVDGVKVLDIHHNQCSGSVAEGIRVLGASTGRVRDNTVVGTFTTRVSLVAGVTESGTWDGVS